MLSGAKVTFGAIVFALVVGLAAWSLSISTEDAHVSTSGELVSPLGNSTASSGLLLGTIPDVAPLALHSIADVQSLVNKTLIVPSTAVLNVNGSSLTMVGVLIDSPPPTDWMVTIYYWNQPFFNGSTTINDILNTGGIAIVESPAPPGVNDSAIAKEAGAPLVVCQGKSRSSQCTATSTVTGNAYTVTQNGVPITVNPYTPELYWADDKQLLYLDLVGGSGVSIIQLLGIADTMT